MSASEFAKSDYVHAFHALAAVNKRLAQFREDHRRGIVSAHLVRQYEVLVSYAERDVQERYSAWMESRG
jgi:hypothetical protein